MVSACVSCCLTRCMKPVVLFLRENFAQYLKPTIINNNSIDKSQPFWVEEAHYWICVLMIFNKISRNLLRLTALSHLTDPFFSYLSEHNCSSDVYKQNHAAKIGGVMWREALFQLFDPALQTSINTTDYSRSILGLINSLHISFNGCCQNYCLELYISSSKMYQCRGQELLRLSRRKIDLSQ